MRFAPSCLITASNKIGKAEDDRSIINLATCYSINDKMKAGSLKTDSNKADPGRVNPYTTFSVSPCTTRHAATITSLRSPGGTARRCALYRSSTNSMASQRLASAVLASWSSPCKRARTCFHLYTFAYWGRSMNPKPLSSASWIRRRATSLSRRSSPL
jgi:hypothetical protein